jgi:uncharacterized cupredoxin-like copper-binding protein
MKRRRWGTVGLCAPLIVTVATACGGDALGDSEAVDVSLRLADFSVKAEVDRVVAGRYDLRIRNDGPTVHELIVGQTDRAMADLPLQTNGIDADEDKIATIAADEFIGFGDTDVLTVDLLPGTYVLYCNIDGHYRSGMFTSLTVVAA